MTTTTTSLQPQNEGALDYAYVENNECFDGGDKTHKKEQEKAYDQCKICRTL